jgi:hypothetical protein
MLWTTVVIRIRKNDRSSCTILKMFTGGITRSRPGLGRNSERHHSSGKLHLCVCIRTSGGAHEVS